MNIKFYFPLLFVAATVAVSCNVDENYDLSNIKADDITIGSDESVFNLPVTTLTLTSDDLDGYATGTKASALDNSSLSDVIRLVSALLPSDSEVDVSALTADNNDAEVAKLVEELIEELSTNEEKSEELASILYDYKDDFSSEETIEIYEFLGLDKDDASITEDEIHEAIKACLDDDAQTEEFKSILTDVIQENVVEDLKIYSEINVDNEMGVIDIPSDIIDMIKENVDGDTSKLNLIATYEHNFPFSFSFSSIALVNGFESFTFIMSEDGEEILNEVDVDLLTSILESGDGASLVLDINLNTFTSGISEDNYIKIKLSVQKTGALVLNF